MDDHYLDSYKGKKILVTGGFGFIGLNICLRLVEIGADITLFGQSTPPKFLSGLAELRRARLRIVVADIRESDVVQDAIRGQDIIFNLAGMSGAAESNRNPFLDLDVNCRGHLTILEACRHHNPFTVIIFPSSRLVYGKPRYLPVDEKHPLMPESIYAAHKLAVENYHLIYSKLYGLKSRVLRISNPFGPMQILDSRRYGIANIFIQSALMGKEIRIFGDGAQMRDYIYIDDLVDAFLKAGYAGADCSSIYNIGGKEKISLMELARMAVEIAGAGTISTIPWPEEYREIETGDYQSNIELAKRELKWEPVFSIHDGIVRTVEEYRKHLS